jgi:hypothetical protein
VASEAGISAASGVPTTYSKWLASLDKRLQQEASGINRRIIKVVVQAVKTQQWRPRGDGPHDGRQPGDSGSLLQRHSHTSSPRLRVPLHVRVNALSLLSFAEHYYSPVGMYDDMLDLEE